MYVRYSNVSLSSTLVWIGIRKFSTI